jgi:hypothetical protein
MIKNNSFLKIEKTISLPIAVETQAIVITWNEELYILINSAANKETFVFKLNTSLSFEKIARLPLLSTSATICKHQLIVIGANSEGKPLVIAINNSGEIQKENILEITPTIWPVMACSNETIIAWQENATEIERGYFNVETNKIEKLPSISVSNPPAIIFPLKEEIVATLSEKNKTHLINLTSGEITNLDISQPMAIGKTINSIFYGWLEKDTVSLKFLKNSKEVNFHLKNASLGKLNAISGKEATLWIQKQETEIDNDYQWNSAIIQENTAIFEIEGFIYAVGSWNDKIILIQSSRLILLKKSINN